jgi:hypothetical protein
MRDIGDVLLFRNDISPFLVHLTKKAKDGTDPKIVLKQILSTRKLISGSDSISDARFGMITSSMSEPEKCQFFSAICFTETPISEIHCLLEIKGRTKNLEPYGIVFLLDKLSKKGVSPVIYLNNERSNKDNVMRALCSLITSHPNEAREILSLISVFGKKLTPVGASSPQLGDYDFRWEREWRYPSCCGEMTFQFEEIFIGLCPHDEIEEFEKLFQGIGFIDPTMNMKWYARALIQARQRCNLRNSVV